MPDFDFNAPLTGNAQQRDDAVKSALGLRVDEARELVAALDSHLSAKAWGYAQLDDVADEVQRAIVSDQIRSAAHGIEENMVEARLHELDVIDLVGPNGLTMPYAKASINDHLHNDRVELHTVGFFRAFGSTLDCLAAVLIGVLRIPMSLRFADMGRLATFDPGGRGRLWPDSVPETQREAWTEFIDLLDALRRRAPEGWYVWGLEMRNALLHRGRGVKRHSQCASPGARALSHRAEPKAHVRGRPPARPLEPRCNLAATTVGVGGVRRGRTGGERPAWIGRNPSSDAGFIVFAERARQDSNL